MRWNKAAHILALAASVALAGCQANDVLALRDKAPIPEKLVTAMKAKGMTPASPIMMRVFKEENVVEVWKQKDTGKFDLVKTYEICAKSGELGPKFKEGDRQAPEGFYLVSRHLLNPNSSYHLSFNLGFPNAYDRSHGRTGTNLMIHGDCSSAGCYAMTDEGISEIYAFAREALFGGRQDAFQVQAFPFRMTAENMAKHRNSPHFEYWSMLKEGYDHFELTKQPPKVDVCERKYVFNQVAVAGEFKATAACPEMQMPEPLALAYQSHQKKYATEFEKALAKLEGRTPAAAAPAMTPIPQAQAPVTGDFPPAPQTDTASADAATAPASPPSASAAPVVEDRPVDQPVSAVQ